MTVAARPEGQGTCLDSGAGAGVGRTLSGCRPVRRWHWRGGTLPAALEERIASYRLLPKIREAIVWREA